MAKEAERWHCHDCGSHGWATPSPASSHPSFNHQRPDGKQCKIAKLRDLAAWATDKASKAVGSDAADLAAFAVNCRARVIEIRRAHG